MSNEHPPVVINLDGKIKVIRKELQKGILNEPIETSSALNLISVYDRGFLYGDSLYEVVRTHGQKPLEVEAHLMRLLKSCDLCRLKPTLHMDELRKRIELSIQSYFKEHPNGEAYCRIILTRGVGKIGFGLRNIYTPNTVLLIVQELKFPTSVQLEQGLSLKIANRLRNSPKALEPAMKSGNYLNNVLAFFEADDPDLGTPYDDALMCNSDGHLTEGTTFNLFYIKNKIVVTPPLDIGILAGIARRRALKIAQKIGLQTREVRFPRERIYEADEVFITSTIKDVFPVTKVDARKIKKGLPGPLTLKLREAFIKSL